ncbi:unnamed protein product [Soboliphyme baturini]|uniref:F5/8 type C domain-containing protein n=1 Tax=Soboliphyme baturini TaxID=241478 RepID=A0A183IJ91_9BILA|nr:unnamed protein product [Soboliphyme baturini]
MASVFRCTYPSRRRRQEDAGQFNITWPVRFVRRIFYPNGEVGLPEMRQRYRWPAIGIVLYYARRCVCAFVCANIYFGASLIACSPCLQHYVKRIDSAPEFYRFARKFSTICGCVYNIIILCLSSVVFIALLVLNIMWLKSIVLLGNDMTVPHVNQVCIQRNFEATNAKPVLMASAARQDQALWECKSIFENSGKFRWTQKKPHPWIIVKHVDEQTITAWIDVDAGKDASETTSILYDITFSNVTACYRNRNHPHSPPSPRLDSRVGGKLLRQPREWPFWAACDCNYEVKFQPVLSCI